MRALLALCVLGLGSVAAAQDQPLLEPGSPVTANFRSEGRWFPALIVEDLGDGSFRVVYQDGWTETRARDQLALDVLRPGVAVDAPRDRVYQRATVERRLDDVALVVFADGVRAWRGVGQLGIPSEALAGDPYVAPESPEPVLATWKEDATWLYPGQVVEAEGERQHVVYQDGTHDWRPSGQVRAGSVKEGEAVEVRTPGTQDYLPATVARRVGAYAVELAWPDGSHTWTALSRLRVAAAF